MGSHHVNPLQVQKCVENMDFPASKQQLLDFAQQHHDPPEIIDALYRLPDRRFATSADVSQTVGWNG